MPSTNDMATLSTNSVHRVIDGATHMSLIVDVSSVRSVRPLVR
jgi:pyruvate/2-oxoglutarate dehydrogenase complex dihydrolipoamide acyltransferase (E2) component